MPYSGSMAGAFRQRHERAVRAALQAGAQVLINGLKEQKPAGLAGGYTSGAFVTGEGLASIFMADPQQDGGVWVIFVATDDVKQVYWEYGHFNLFTRKYEREERWHPTANRKAGEVHTAYARVYDRFMS